MGPYFNYVRTDRGREGEPKAYGFVQGGREGLKLMRTQLHTRWSLLCEIAHETENAVAEKSNTQMPVIKDLLVGGVQKCHFSLILLVRNFFRSDFCADHENAIHFYQKSKFSWFFSNLGCL